MHLYQIYKRALNNTCGVLICKMSVFKTDVQILVDICHFTLRGSYRSVLRHEKNSCIASYLCPLNKIHTANRFNVMNVVMKENAEFSFAFVKYVQSQHKMSMACLLTF